MSRINLDLDDDVMALLQTWDRPVQESVREFVVLELHRRGLISGGRAAELLGLSRQAFIHFAAEAGIPYFALTSEEWAAEQRRAEQL